MTHHLDLSALTLAHGSHDDREQGVCLLEAVAWFAGEPHSDAPACVSPILAVFGRSWNDALDDTARQQLTPFIPRMAGTADDGHDGRRFWLLVDWLIRSYSPPWLRLAGLTADADALAGLPEVTGPEQVETARPVIDAACERSDAAWNAAWNAAGDAARVAAGDAARERLAPTVAEVQASTLELLGRLCAPAGVPA